MSRLLRVCSLLAVVLAGAVFSVTTVLARTVGVRCSVSTEFPVEFAASSGARGAYGGVAVDGGWVAVPLDATAISNPGKLVNAATGSVPGANVLPRGQTWERPGELYQGRPNAKDPAPPGAPADAWLITIDVTQSAAAAQTYGAPTGTPPVWRWTVTYSLPRLSCPASASGPTTTQPAATSARATTTRPVVSVVGESNGAERVTFAFRAVPVTRDLRFEINAPRGDSLRALTGPSAQRCTAHTDHGECHGRPAATVVITAVFVHPATLAKLNQYDAGAAGVGEERFVLEFVRRAVDQAWCLVCR